MNISKKFIQILTIILILFLSSCSFRHGLLISISPQNNITEECFLETVTKLHPDIKFQTRSLSKDTRDTHSYFVMNENFVKSFTELGLSINTFQGGINASFLFKDDILKTIEFFLSYNESDFQKLSEVEKNKFSEFIKPYTSAAKNLPSRLEQSCSLKVKPEDIKIKCFGSLCEKI